MGCSQSTPVQEPVAAAPASNASGTVAAPGSAPASQTSAAQAPASNASKTSAEPAVASAPQSGASAPKKTYAVSGVSITAEGIVYYHIEAADGSVSLKKRYNDFKLLYSKLPNAKLLPALPQANLGALFKGKHNPALIKEREEQFEVLLNAIACNAAFAGTDAFQAFIAA